MLYKSIHSLINIHETEQYIYMSTSHQNKSNPAYSITNCTGCTTNYIGCTLSVVQPVVELDSQLYSLRAGAKWYIESSRLRHISCYIAVTVNGRRWSPARKTAQLMWLNVCLAAWCVTFIKTVNRRTCCILHPSLSVRLHLIRFVVQREKNIACI